MANKSLIPKEVVEYASSATIFQLKFHSKSLNVLQSPEFRMHFLQM